MKIERKFTKAGQDAYAELEFVTTSSEIRNPDGTIVFKLDNVEVPASWSQEARDVIASLRLSLGNNRSPDHIGDPDGTIDQEAA